jgi:dTDP-4-dehydrorhamnose 3,5-epimerase
MRFVGLPIPGAYRVELDKREDERGFFARTFCAEEFRARGLVTDFVQRSVSFNSRRGTLRGMHYQAASHIETKLVRCTVGAAFDVLVDIRRNSPTFGRWHSETISADNHLLLYIPEGCAHGFQTLADATELYYEITPAYVSEAARGIAFDDPNIGIPWPIANPLLSASDRARPRLAQAEIFA